MDLNTQKNVALAPYTTYQIGGPADLFVEVTDSALLARAINYARDNSIPYFLLGTGANILVGDKGFRGLVIHNAAKSFVIEGQSLTAESGATIGELIEQTSKAGLSGLEHFAGIPSTVGGAMWQNLHFLSPDRASTVFIGDIVQEATVLLEDNSVAVVTKDFFEFGYDDSILHHCSVIVLGVTFNLDVRSTSKIVKQAEHNLAWRQSKQPQLNEYPSCGSVFQKIKDVGAGRLIAQAGLQGFTIGGAQVSTKHANYIINVGSATASDVLAVIKHIQKIVRSKTGHALEPEISFIGEF